jgi:hypothetical protein
MVDLFARECCVMHSGVNRVLMRRGAFSKQVRCNQSTVDELTLLANQYQ